MPKIDSFKSGSIVIGGKTYRNDVVVLSDGTVKQRKGGLWKFGGHVVKKGEIDELVVSKPVALVIGSGTESKVVLASDAIMALRGVKVDLIVLPTPEAVEKFNQLVAEGQQVAALFHITC